MPLGHDRNGHVTREVAPARFALPLSDSPGHTLPLSLARIRDLRRGVPLRDDPAQSQQVERWDADLKGASGYGWKSDWGATPPSPPPTEPARLAMVPTASEADAVERVQTSTHRWPAQENGHREFLLSLGLDTTHGCANVPVANADVAKIREGLERTRAQAQRVAQSARERMARAWHRSEHANQQAKAHQAERLHGSEARPLLAQQPQRPDPAQVDTIVARQQVAQAALLTSQQRKPRAEETSRAALEACERACPQQRHVLRA